MTVLILERVPASLRGELSRWMIEPHIGVFVGRLSGIVRDLLWARAVKGAKGGAGIMVFATANDQGFTIRTFGDPSRSVKDWEGIQLVYIPRRVGEDGEEGEESVVV